MPSRPLKTVLCCILLFSVIHSCYAQTGTVSIGIATPGSRQVVDSNLSIQANVLSTYQISTVVAAIKGRSLSMTAAGGGVYTGALSLSGLPVGVVDTLTIVATDINGNKDTASETAIYDQAPKVTIVRPYADAVARPTFNLVATGAASSGHCQLQVTMRVPVGIPSTVTVGTFTDSVNTTIDLSAYNGMSPTEVTVTAVDSFGASSFDGRNVYVETSPYLTPVYSADNDIVDFYNNKAVAMNQAGSLPTIGDIRNNTVTTLPFNGTASDVRLSNEGMVFWGKPAGSTRTSLYDWNNGNMDSVVWNLGLANVVVNGDYCVWNFNSFLYFRNLATQTTQPAGTGTWNDVSASGTGAYYHNNSIYDSILLYQNGSAAAVQTNSNGFMLLNPVTDGNNAAYIQLDLSNNKSIYRYDAKTGTNSLLSNLSSSALPLPPEPFYTVNNGYTAFLNPDASGSYQAWIRDTAGNLVQASPFSLPSTLERLSSNGQLSFLNSSVNENGARYIYNPRSGILVNISSSFGKPYWQDLDSTWYVALGNTLFRVNLNISADKADSFAVDVKEDSLYTFSTNDFATHYHTSGSLLTVTFSKLPAHGSLILNGSNIALNQSIPESGLSKLVYKPLLNFTGKDTAVWIGSNGYTASPPGALLVIHVDSLLPAAPAIPVISGLRAGYCGNLGQPVSFNVTNMPASNTNTTVVATLDGQPLAITAGGVLSFQPWNTPAGSHTVAVIFSNSLGADTTSAVFTIVQASTPKVTLAANPSTLTTGTTQVVLTATDVSGGGSAPLYTFSTDYSFNSNILQAESSNNTMTLAVASLAIGRNVVYVRMATSDSCATAAIGVDSVVLDRVQDTTVAPAAPKISGLMGDYCHNAGSQQVSVSNMPEAGSGVTVTGTLDGQPVAVSSGGAITLQPQALSVGTHGLAIIFTDAAGADTTTGNFVIDSAVTPVVKLTVSPTPLTAATTEFELVATPVAGGGDAPQYVFAKTANFSLPSIVGQGSSNATTISVNSLVAGNNVFYVQMTAFDSCVTSNTAVDSVVVVKPADSTGQRSGGKVTIGPNPFAGTVTIGDLDPNKSYSISLSNAFGQTLITQVVVGQTQAVLLTGSLQRGVYFLRVTDLGTGKLVIASILLSGNR